MTDAAFRPAAGAEPIPGYRLDALLGRGGFGEVWRATAPGGFPVALKFLAAEGATTGRELRSLQMLQRVRDGHLLVLSGVWSIPGFYLLGMELADCTLSDRFNACRLQDLPGVPRDELLDYFEQAARGIDFLNEPRHVLVQDGKPVGIQHGDIKPQNLLLVGSLCKVGDFGLLRELGGLSQKTDSMTAAYAPPEVLERHPAPQSDQYSLAVAWCLLRGGRLPHEGDVAQVIKAHLFHQPDLTMLPKEERPVVARALNKDPAERWPSCRAFVEALRAPKAEKVIAPPVPIARTLPTSFPRRSGPTALASDAGRRGIRGALLWSSLILLAAVAAVLTSRGFFKRETPPAEGDRRARADNGRPSPKGSPSQDDGPQNDRDGPREGEPFTNSVGMQFVWIEPGSFLMGSPDGKTPPGVPEEEERSQEETPHRVTLTRGYHLGVHLVTQWQWEQVLGKEANRSKFRGEDDDEKKKLPIDTVSWEDCQDFCRKLGVREGRKYRLPSEAEWEHACRARTGTAFWWGDTISTNQANYDGKFAYGKDGRQETYRERTTPVAFFKPNPWGLYDMHGNLYQWCEDYHAPYREDDQKDPVSLKYADQEMRVLRGGCWGGPPGKCRAAFRHARPPGYRHDVFGCRLVLSLD